MVLPWTYSSDPHLAAYIFAAAASYSQMQQQSDFWQQAKNNLINNSTLMQSNGQQAARQTASLPTALSGLLPASMPPLFVAPPLIPNPLNAPSSTTSSSTLPISSEQSNTSATTPSMNSIPPYLPNELSYNLMLRSLGFGSTPPQPNQSASQLNHGFLTHLRELSDAQSNQSIESSNFKLSTDRSIKPPLDFRSSSSASNSSDCSSPAHSPNIPAQLTNNNYLTNSSSSSLSGHNSIINCKLSNQSLKNLNQMSTKDQSCSPNSLPNLNSPINGNHLFQSNGATFSNGSNGTKSIKSESSSPLNSSSKIELLKSSDLTAIENFNSVLAHQTGDLIGSNCLNKPLFQPYLSKL